MSPGAWSQETSFAEWPAPVASPGRSAGASEAATAEAAKATTGEKKGMAGSPSTLSASGLTAQMGGSGPAVQPAAGPGMSVGTTFNSVFGSQGGYGNKTLLEVLRLNSNGGRDGLARHLVAAYLNAVKGYTPAVVLDVVTAKNIWTSFVARGYYEPTAGIRWFPDYAEPVNPRGGVIAWIKTTMPR